MLAFLAHEEVTARAAVRPAEYLFDFDRLIVKRDASGIWYDALSLDYRRLMDKYQPRRLGTRRSAYPPQPLEAHWQAWREEGGRWIAAGRLRPGFFADPPGFDPLPGERLSTPGFKAGEFQGKASTGPIDVVIPLGRGSRHGDAELRYALRSIERYLENLGRVWIVGERPDWLVVDGDRLIHLPVPDICPIADVSMLNKIGAAASHGNPPLSGRFVQFCDDVLLLRPVGWTQLGPYHTGDLNARAQWNGGWWKRMEHTRDWLLAHGKTTLNGDGHFPIPMERTKLLRLLNETDWRTPPGMCLGPLYMNWTDTSMRPAGQEYNIITPGLSAAEIRRRVAGRWFLCHTNNAFTPEFRALLDELFPEKCQWEEGFHPHDNPMRRNLIYHVYPFAGNGEWRANIARLRRSWDLFNGRKIVGIVTDERSVGADAVKAAFPDDATIEWLLARNEPLRGETVTFLPAAGMLRSLRRDEATFYAHAKGVSPEFPPHGKGEIRSVRRWRDYLYRGCLEIDRQRLDRVIRNYTAAGCLRYTEHCSTEPNRPKSLWHFAGTFFWFNHFRFFREPWALVLGPTRYALERHFGEFIRLDDAFCLAGDGIDPFEDGSMYRWSNEKWDALEAEAFGTGQIVPPMVH